MKHGETGSCSSCDQSIEFHDKASKTYPENVVNITCYSHKTGCQPGYGFKIGASHA